MTDLISRQAAIDAVRSYYDECDEREESIEERIEQLPSADVQPVRHGRWVEEPNCMYRCSSCGSHYPSIRGYMDYCYCSSCGARMDGERK